MQISCERCSTVYVLDDKLIPPGGAPVQCTRCGLVFTAKPPPGAVAAAPAPKPTAPPKPMPRMPTPHAAAAAPADDRRSTMMFGGAGSPTPPPAAAPHATMMFGGTAPTPAPAPAARPTPVANAHATMMFGGAGAPAASGPAPAASAAAAANPNSTMMFGAVKAPPPQAPAPAGPESVAAAAANPNSTMMFGAVNAPAPAVPQHTQMFGGTSPREEPEQASDQGATVLLGRSPFEDQASQPPAPASTADAAASASTMMFGTSPFASKAPAATATPAPQRAAGGHTMMFGAAPAAGEVEKPAGPPPAAIPSASSTMMFGAAPGAEPPLVDRAPAVEMPANKAQPARATPKPQRPTPKVKRQEPEPGPVHEPEAETVSGSPEEEPLPPQQPVAPAPAWMAPAGEAEAPAPRKGRGRQAPQPAALPQPPAPVRAPPQPLVGSSTMELQLSLKKRQRKLPLILGVLALLIALTVAAVVLLKMRTPPADPALVAADGKAWELLKRDDERSIEQAIEAWDQLVAKAPEFVPARANLMVAHVLMNQDLRDETRRLLAQYQQLAKDLTKLEERKEPADWRAKANALREEMIKIKAVYEPLQQEAARHDEKSGELLKSSKALVERLGAAGDGTAVFRSSALYYASKGQDATEKLAEFYRKNPDERNVLHDDARAFADLAVAGRYAQTRVTPGDRDKAKAAVEATLQKDPKLLRAYLFMAKVYFANKEYDAATAELDKLLKLNPEHKVAEKLKAEIAETVAAAKRLEEKAAQRAAAEKAEEEKAAQEKAPKK